jgi:hypothetical protein
MTGKHNLIHPADIICRKKEIAEKMTEALEDGADEDLMDLEEEVEKNVLQERKDALQKALEEAEKQRKQKKLINPLEVELALNDEELIDYVPTFGWEKEPATEKQLKYLQTMQIATDGEDICKGRASKIIDRLSKRRELGLATPRQAEALKKFGFQNTYNWTFEEAKKMMGQLAMVGFKKWRLPFDTADYIPISLRGRKEIEW